MRALESRGLEDATPSDAGLDGNGLLEWYFEARLGRAVPVDIDQYCRDLGLAGRAALERVLAREFCYVEAESVKAGTEGEDSGIVALVRALCPTLAGGEAELTALK